LAGTALPSVTIGLVPRERFSYAARALTRIFETAAVDFQLVVVDCDTPRTYWQQIEVLIAGRPNVEVLRADRYLLPNESRNLVTQAASGEYTCMIENDVLVSPGWLTRLLETAVECDADAVAPFLMERNEMQHHFDAAMGQIEHREGANGRELRIEPLAGPEALEAMTSPRPIEMAECHCLLFRTDVLRRMPPFDGRFYMNEFIDTSLALHQAGAKLVFEPRSRVTFMPPPPVEPAERDFYLSRWDFESAMRSHRLLKEKWGLAALPAGLDTPDSTAFLHDRHHQLSLWQWRRYLIRTRWKWPLGRVKRYLLRGFGAPST
jgi:GT2 family glycosyltransferase